MKSVEKTLVVLALVMGPATAATAEIREWGGAQSGFEIVQVDLAITITAPGTYKFQSVVSGQPAQINEVTVHSGVSGDVHLVIARDPAEGDGPGASDVDLLNLGTTANTFIDELNITGDLGADGVTRADHLAGNLTIDGTMLSGLTLYDASTVSICIGDDLDGDILITNDAGGATLDITGDLLNYESISGDNFGDITIGGDAKPYTNILLTSTYDATLSIGGTLGGGAHIIIDGPTTTDALIDIDSHVYGTIRVKSAANHRTVIGGNLSGTLQYDQSFDGSNADTHPEINITGNMSTGSVIVVGGDWAGGACVAGDVSGEFRIAGSFVDNDELDGEDVPIPNIKIDGAFSATSGGAAIAVD